MMSLSKVPLPIRQHVRLVKNGMMYQVITSRYKNPVGRRLDRGKGKYPERNAVTPLFKEALAALEEWNEFMELNKPS